MPKKAPVGGAYRLEDSRVALYSEFRGPESQLDESDLACARVFAGGLLAKSDDSSSFPLSC